LRESPETLELHFRCSALRKSYMVLLERKPPSQIYRVIEIRVLNVTSHSGSESTPPTKGLNVNVDQIDHHDIRCPHCNGGKWWFIKCGSCGELSCSGGVKESGGKYLHVCPWCESQGYITSNAVTLSGKSSSKEVQSPPREFGLLPP